MTDRERLSEILEDALHEWECDVQPETLSQIAEHLLSNGVIVPPCKVGDTVYQIDTAGNIYESEITKTIYDTYGIAFDERAIGKSIFLTRDEAEQALAERQTP